MPPISQTLIDSVGAPFGAVYALLTDPGRIPEWLPDCTGVQCEGPIRKGARFKARFGTRLTEFEVVDFAPPMTFGWSERGERNGWKTLFRLDAGKGATALTIRYVWVPRSFGAGLRGRLFQKRRVERQLNGILDNLRYLLRS